MKNENRSIKSQIYSGLKRAVFLIPFVLAYHSCSLMREFNHSEQEMISRRLRVMNDQRPSVDDFANRPPYGRELRIMDLNNDGKADGLVGVGDYNPVYHTEDWKYEIPKSSIPMSPKLRELASQAIANSREMSLEMYRLQREKDKDKISKSE